MTTPYIVRLTGCDDETEIPMDLTPNEADLIRRLSAASHQASEYGCMPKLHLEESPNV